MHTEFVQYITNIMIDMTIQYIKIMALNYIDLYL